MSGIINQTGSRSGTIGRTEGGMVKIKSFPTPPASGKYGNVFSAGFTSYHVVISNLIPATDSVQCYMGLLDSSNAKIDASNYRYVSGGSQASSGTQNVDQIQKAWDDTNWNITPAGQQVGDGSDNEGMQCVLTFHNPSSSTYMTHFYGTTGCLIAGGAYVATSICSGIYNATTSASGFDIFFSSGAISTGRVSIYGYAD